MLKQLITKLLLLIIVLPITLLANTIIEISADGVVIDQKSLVSHYTGNVVFSQGDTTLMAHEVKITVDGESNYQVVALGNSITQAQFVQKGASDIHSVADKIIYFTKQQFIQLFGNAKLSQNGNAFNGEKINYDFTQDKVFMSGEGNKRVKLKIKL